MRQQPRLAGLTRGLVFSIGETVNLPVRWNSAAGTATNKTLGTVDFVVRLADTSGNVWTDTHLLTERL